MAINEACSLWIEQRISEELEEKEITGKSLREIGREISAEIERIFEAKVKPETLTMKASRMQGVTNVTPESKVIETITEMPKILENRHPQGGGTRENGVLNAVSCETFTNKIILLSHSFPVNLEASRPNATTLVPCGVK